MKYVKIVESLQVYANELGNVFYLSDLKNILAQKNKAQFYEIIRNLEKLQILKRFTQSVYYVNEPDLKILSQKINPCSYISFETVLSENFAIGTCSKFKLQAVKLGRKRIYSDDKYQIIQLGSSKDMFFGFTCLDGVNVADKEKALIDTLYYYQKGTKYYFDIYSDIDFSLFDKGKIFLYLKKYKNNKFTSFVKGLLA
ncbi:MAG: hypothetical protein ABIA04_05375 [Pseudomonadota bacterium]